MEYTFNEKMVIKILQDNLIFDIAGLEIEIENEGKDEKELEKFMEMENLLNEVDGHMLEAFERGYFKSHRTDGIIESKHIKFAGKEKMQMMKMLAVAGTMGECHFGKR